MRRGAARLLIGALCAPAAVACSTTVLGSGSPPAASTSAAPAPPPSAALPGGPEQPCPPGGCTGGNPPAPVGVVCAPLSSARAVFDSAARAAYPGGALPTSGSTATWSPLTGLVTTVVDRCGYQVMKNVAAQYPDPLSSWLTGTAVAALGPLAQLPGGLFCRDLAARGYDVQAAVDYWFLWARPDNMDADLNGIPCETVFADVPAHMPSN